MDFQKYIDDIQFQLDDTTRTLFRLEGAMAMLRRLQEEQKGEQDVRPLQEANPETQPAEA